jgi:uncharacterized protein YdcH (DUF465 family)
MGWGRFVKGLKSFEKHAEHAFSKHGSVGKFITGAEKKAESAVGTVYHDAVDALKKQQDAVVSLEKGLGQAIQSPTTWLAILGAAVLGLLVVLKK